MTPFSLTLTREGGLLLATGGGSANTADLLGLLDLLAAISVQEGQKYAIADLSRVEIQLRFTDYVQLGIHAARALSHLDRGAAVVRPQDYKGIADKVAQKLGLPARIFTSPQAAREWIAERAGTRL